MTNKKTTYSRPAIKKTLVVSSDAAIKAAQQYLKTTLSSIYALDVILYYISDEATSEAANKHVADIFEEKIAEFTKQINKYQKVVEENDLSDIVYTQNHSEEYLIYSPLCTQYLQLIKKFDLLTNLIDQLWLNAHMDSKRRNKEVLKLKRHLLNVSRQVINASRNAMRLAKLEGKEDQINETVSSIGLDNETAKDVLDTSKPNEVVENDADIEQDDTEQEETVLSKKTA